MLRFHELYADWVESVVQRDCCTAQHRKFVLEPYIHAAFNFLEANLAKELTCVCALKRKESRFKLRDGALDRAVLVVTGVLKNIAEEAVENFESLQCGAVFVALNNCVEGCCDECCAVFLPRGRILLHLVTEITL